MNACTLSTKKKTINKKCRLMLVVIKGKSHKIIKSITQITKVTKKEMNTRNIIQSMTQTMKVTKREKPLRSTPNMIPTTKDTKKEMSTRMRHQFKWLHLAITQSIGMHSILLCMNT